MTTIVAKNNNTFDVMIEDLGISVPKSNQIELVGIEGIFNIFEVTSSVSLKDLVSSSLIMINDGILDLSIEDGIKHLTLITEHEQGV